MISDLEHIERELSFITDPVERRATARLLRRYSAKRRSETVRVLRLTAENDARLVAAGLILPLGKPSTP